MDYKEYLKSDEWEDKRNAVLAYWGFICALCSSPKNVQVHHRTYDRVYHELMTDLIPLCENCHERHHAVIGRSMKMEPIKQVMERL